MDQVKIWAENMKLQQLNRFLPSLLRLHGVILVVCLCIWAKMPMGTLAAPPPGNANAQSPWQRQPQHSTILFVEVRGQIKESSKSGVNRDNEGGKTHQVASWESSLSWLAEFLLYVSTVKQIIESYFKWISLWKTTFQMTRVTAEPGDPRRPKDYVTVLVHRLFSMTESSSDSAAGSHRTLLFGPSEEQIWAWSKWLALYLRGFSLKKKSLVIQRVEQFLCNSFIWSFLIKQEES